MTIIFSDKKNYPHGFRRSGDFSIKESERLEKFGHLFTQLLTGQKKPANAEEKNYLAQLSGKSEASDAEVQAWIKYQKKISQSKQYFPLCSTPSEDELPSKKSSSANSDDDDSLDSDDVDMDVDGSMEEDEDDVESEET